MFSFWSKFNDYENKQTFTYLISIKKNLCHIPTGLLMEQVKEENQRGAG